MRVYRVEHHRKRHGPYQYSEVIEIVPFIPRRQPLPQRDGITDPKMIDMHFGFESVRQMLDWFDAKVLDALKAYGYIVAAYEVDVTHMLRGRCQVCFLKEKAVLVSEEVSY